MQTFKATIDWHDDVIADGEGDVHFQWEDYIFGYECLTIVQDGHCSRRMPIRSGFGLKGYTLRRDRITFQFTPELAKLLELDEQIEIQFDLSDEEFARFEAAMGTVSCMS